MRQKKSFILVFIISGLVIFLSRCINNVENNTDSRGNMYAGSAACRQCHQSIYDSCIASAHYNTTRPSSKENVLGSFTSGQNIYAYDSLTKIIMEHKDSGLFQVFYRNGTEVESHRFDITFGMKHAQTFAYWEGNKFFELPVSYYTSPNTWVSSPGFSSTQVYFKRLIGRACFECHSSFIDSKFNEHSVEMEEVFNKNSFISGIDCERCHGPAINHVNYHLAYPDVKIPKYIVSQHTLTRQQKLDVCALCHSGNDKKKEISSFKFRMGDTLANFFLPWATHRNSDSDFDVHGNQYQLLSESKCFLASKTLNCSTCHDPHTNAGNDLTVYSNKCIACHQNTDHSSLKLNEVAANLLQTNCISCHMPERPSRAVTFQLAGSNVKSAYLLRTHKIAVYDDKK